MEYQTIANPDGTISIVPINQQQGIMVPAYETSQLDLVNQINQGPRNIGAPMTLEETMAGSVLPPDPRRFQSIFPTTGIMQQAPLQNLGIDTSYGVANEEDVEQVDSLTGEKKSSGILDLIMSIAIPGYGFLKNIGKGGLEGIRGLNQRLRQSDFGQAKNLSDYFDMRSYGGLRERENKSAQTMAQARGIQKQMAQRPSATPSARDLAMGRGEGDGPQKDAAATRSRDLGSMRGAVGR